MSTNASRRKSQMGSVICSTTATQTPTAPTPRARSTARATQATLETESRALVRSYRQITLQYPIGWSLN